MKGERKPQEYCRLWWKVEKKVEQIRRQYIFELTYPELTYPAQQSSLLLPPNILDKRAVQVSRRH